ncbi:hypothetical protein ACN09C_18080 [Serratia fonticola]|jgi:hypothetical protein|uniref:hypothetical protein n=1 Tax=Serratia fonticola TaxID=47917 RepID=UPI003AFF7BDC
MMDAIEFLKQCRAVNPAALMSVDVRPVDKIVISWQWTIKGQTYGMGQTFDQHMLQDPGWVDATFQDLHQRALAANQGAVSDSQW